MCTLVSLLLGFQYQVSFAYQKREKKRRKNTYNLSAVQLPNSTTFLAFPVQPCWKILHLDCSSQSSFHELAQAWPLDFLLVGKTSDMELPTHLHARLVTIATPQLVLIHISFPISSIIPRLRIGLGRSQGRVLGCGVTRFRNHHNLVAPPPTNRCKYLSWKWKKFFTQNLTIYYSIILWIEFDQEFKDSLPLSVQ